MDQDEKAALNSACIQAAGTLVAAQLGQPTVRGINAYSGLRAICTRPVRKISRRTLERALTMITSGTRPGPKPSQSRCFALAASAETDAYIENGVLVAIRSIRQTNPGIPIVVLHSGFTERQKRMFDSVRFIQVPNEGFVRSDHFKADRPDVPDATFFHLSIERIVEFDTALYVDGDTVILDNVDELFAMDVPFAGRLMHDYPLSDQFEDGRKLLETEGIVEDFALNAGVMRYDLRYWREVGLTQEALDLGKRYGWNTFKWAD
jgi:hypothetical protein